MNDTNIDVDGLAPCPHCGSTEVFVQNAGWKANTFMRCPGCKTTFSLDNGTPRAHEDTVAAWNRRSALQPTDAGVGEPVAGEWVLVPREPTEEMGKAGRKKLAEIADRMETAKLTAVSHIDFWQQVGHVPNNEIWAAMLAAAPEAGVAVGVEAAWRDLVEKTDRTSPEDYPDMALITKDELADYMAALASPTVERAWDIVAEPLADLADVERRIMEAARAGQNLAHLEDELGEATAILVKAYRSLPTPPKVTP